MRILYSIIGAILFIVLYALICGMFDGFDKAKNGTLLEFNMKEELHHIKNEGVNKKDAKRIRIGEWFSIIVGIGIYIFLGI